MQTLVLDPQFQPVGCVPWQQAVRLWYLNKVEIVDEYEDSFIRSVTVVIKMPSVVRFLAGLRGTRRGVKFSRLNVFQRDSGKCQYCGTKVKLSEFTYDHVIPRAQGGGTSWTNVVTSCVPCNQHKGNRTPAQAGLKLLSEPARPKKLPDFRVRLSWRKGMPDAWRNWLRDHLYWNGDLDQD